jgi:hypothetical protein
MWTLSTSCLLPSPPGKSVYQDKRVLKNAHGEFELYSPTTRDLTQYRSGRERWNTYSDERPAKNLLFVAVDDTVQGQFQEPLQDAYHTNNNVRIEDIAWWRFSPEFRGLYDKVLKIDFKGLNADSLKWGLEYLESLEKEFDVMLLTHGLPNNITASKGQGFISYKDLKSMGPFKNLNLVFMQGCFSETLAMDWIKNGAQTVLSYEGWNRNFFYVDFFLPAYRKKGNAEKAYKEVNATIKAKMQRSWIYGRVLNELDFTLEEYFSVSPHPILDQAQ